MSGQTEFFHGVSCESLYDCGDGAYMELAGNSSRAVFDECVKGLTAKGFSPFSSDSIGENYGATLSDGSCFAHVYYCESEKALRVIYDPFTAVFENEAAVGEAACGTLMYQFETDHSLIDCGMCYIFKCCDGSFFIIDSAHFFSHNDNDRIHKFLSERTPPNKKIVIAGWYFSHAHNDHINKFMDFLKYNADDCIIEKLYYNFVPLSHKDSHQWSQRDRDLMKDFHRLVARYPDIPKVKLHTLQKFYVRNLCFRVLCTHEDVHPESLEMYNCSSTVLMLEVGSTKVLLPGDASGIEGDILLRRYGDYLTADIVQVAHHGHFGLSAELYEAVNARLALFPTTEIKFDEEYEVFEANRRAVEMSEKYIISSNGTAEIPLPYDGTVNMLADETFEDFARINRLWGYEYTDERKTELYREFLRRGGDTV